MHPLLLSLGPSCLLLFLCGFLSDSVDYSSSSYLECFTDVGGFPNILSADGEAFGFTHRRGVQI
jgi:hypothetical protein